MPMSEPGGVTRATSPVPCFVLMLGAETVCGATLAGCNAQFIRVSLFAYGCSFKVESLMYE